MKPRWFPTEDAQLMTLAPRWTYAMLAAHLGRSENAIAQRVYLLRKAGRISPLAPGQYRRGAAPSHREIWALCRLSAAVRERLWWGVA
jgi:hypothetical protein